MTDRTELIAQLRGIEEQVRDLAYYALRAAAAAEGDADAKRDERRLLQARRAIERAIRALDAGDDAGE